MQMLPMKSTPNPIISPKLHPILRTHLSNNPNSIPSPLRALKVSCSSTRDQELLAAELSLQIKKLNSQTEEALNKSREMLFAEVCGFAGLRSEDLRRKWRRMSDDERWVLAKGFVAEWNAHLHPLSARSVKELVDQYLDQGRTTGFQHDSVPARFRRFLGFNNQD